MIWLREQDRLFLAPDVNAGDLPALHHRVEGGKRIGKLRAGRRLFLVDRLRQAQRGADEVERLLGERVRSGGCNDSHRVISYGGAELFGPRLKTWFSSGSPKLPPTVPGSPGDAHDSTLPTIPLRVKVNRLPSSSGT